MFQRTSSISFKKDGRTPEGTSFSFDDDLVDNETMFQKIRFKNLLSVYNELSKGNIIGCFGLTEPDHGSDPSSMQTSAKKVKGGFLLNGSKNWISNSPIADLFLIWAKDEDNIIKGFIIERKKVA